LVEKIIQLDNISPISFLGVENRNIKEISANFPQSKIIARGTEIRIQGSNPEILQISEIFQVLITQYESYGKITLDDVRSSMEQDSFLQKKTAQPETIIYNAYNTAIKARTPNQQTMVDIAGRNDIVVAIGPAGTGKTYVAVALAVKALRNKIVKRIIITRPAVEAGESLGFLPGDMQEKIDPYLRPIYDALHEMIGAERLRHYQEKGVIEIAPIAYMRGRTLSNAFVLIDEAQNTTAMQLKMLLTRMGRHSKMIITGDISQIDLPSRVRSGLVDAYHLLKGVKGIGIAHLEAKDVVRHRLVQDIVNAYQKSQETRDNKQKD
jgi:phosphate starvation-inducible PhoH-like protein